KALAGGVLPPTGNYENRDEDCALNVLSGGPTETAISTALNINQGIGGQSTALIFKKYSE
ncbi:MAG: beta-ketoacyl-[acyl-carrier-protein] synthase II, partial [Deltaproteobacteria bacterium]|nr:beta-ketoacyl-[acyl-carrier-protein] synthase II [Deltaproteobacteria bacterium]